MAKTRINQSSTGKHDGSHLRYAATVDFSRKLRWLMAKAQMSQSDLARECWGEEETSDGYLGARGRDKINRYVTGKTMPDPESLRQIAKVLGVPETELAPSVVGSALEREHPEVRMTVIAGHREHVHLTLDSVMPLNTALQIMQLYESTQTRGATEHERATELPLEQTAVEQAQAVLTKPKAVQFVVPRDATEDQSRSPEDLQLFHRSREPIRETRRKRAAG